MAGKDPRLVRWIGFALLVFGWMILLGADQLLPLGSEKLGLRVLIVGTVSAFLLPRRRPENVRHQAGGK